MKTLITTFLLLCVLRAFSANPSFEQFDLTSFTTNSKIIKGMWGTNAVDGSLTNRNQGLGKVLVAGTNAVITSDTGPAANPWLFVVQTNGEITLRVRSDGSIFTGEYVGIDTSLNNFAELDALYAISMVESNEPSKVEINIGSIGNETYNYFAYQTLYTVGDPVNPVSLWDQISVSTNGSSQLEFLAQPFGGQSRITYSSNGVVVFNMDSNGDLTKIKQVTYSWPTAYGGANSFLTMPSANGTLIWTNPASGSITATNGFSSYSTTAGVALTATGLTNALGINGTAYVTATAVAFTIKNRANATIYTSPTLTTTVSVHLQPGWSVNAASGLSGTLLPD